MGILQASGDDASAHALLQEFQRGYPLEHLRRLLGSDQEHEVRAGVWIASELGESIHPLLDECARLLEHPARYVRFFALDCVLAGATNRDGDAIAAATRLIEDDDEAVRWKTMSFLANASHDQLQAGGASLSGAIAEHVRWLANIDSADAPVIEERLASEYGLIRRFAAVGAARRASHDVQPLRAALQSSDDEVRSFAEERLQLKPK